MIDLLKEHEIDEAVACAKKLHSESIWAHLPYETEYVAKYLKLLLDQPQYGFTLTHKVDGKIVGGLTATISQFPFCNAKLADMYVLFIEKEHRGSHAVVQLIQEYVNVAKVYGVKEIHIGVNSPINQEQVEKLYERIGFTQVGTIWSIPV